MPRLLRRRPAALLLHCRKEDGFTLVEMLMVIALTAMVSTVVWSLLLAVSSNRGYWQQRIGDYEAIRATTARFMADVRLADATRELPFNIGTCDSAMAPPDNLCYLDIFLSATQKIRYTYDYDPLNYDPGVKPYGPFTRAALDEPTSMFRVPMADTDKNGVWEVDFSGVDVVAEGLLPPGGTSTAAFGFGPTVVGTTKIKAAQMLLDTPHREGQSCGPEDPEGQCGSSLQIMAFTRFR